MDTDARSPEVPEPDETTDATTPGPTPPPEAANEVLQDEIESIHAIGEEK